MVLTSLALNPPRSEPWKERKSKELQQVDSSTLLLTVKVMFTIGVMDSMVHSVMERIKTIVYLKIMNISSI